MKAQEKPGPEVEEELGFEAALSGVEPVLPPHQGAGEDRPLHLPRGSGPQNTRQDTDDRRAFRTSEEACTPAAPIKQSRHSEIKAGDLRREQSALCERCVLEPVLSPC